jgi:hypothetical protein
MWDRGSNWYYLFLFLHRCQTVKGNLNTDYCTPITAVWGGRVCLVQNCLASKILVWLLKQAFAEPHICINYYCNVLLIITSVYSLKTHLSMVSKTVFGLTVEIYNASPDVQNLAMFANICTGLKKHEYCYSCITCLFSAIKYNIYIDIFLCLLKFHEQDYNTAIIMHLADKQSL